MSINGESPLPFDRAYMASVSALDVYQALVAIFSEGPIRIGAHAFDGIVWQDASIRFPSGEQMDDALGALTAYQLPYIDGVRTCKQFTDIAFGQLAAMGFGQTTVGEVRLDVFDASGNYLGWHECLIEGDSSGGLGFYEPQYPPSYAEQRITDPITWVFPTADHAVIDFFVF